MRHDLIHTGNKQHTCPYCQKNFSRKDHLKNHLRIHDPNKEMHKCPTCGKEYASPFAFKTHLAFHAADEGELICGVCKDEFEDKPSLVKHLRIHAGARSVKDAAEKRQKCPLCNKMFFTRKDVKRHLVVHTKDRDFLCQYCPQRFGRRDHLVRHLKKAHSNEAGLPPDSEFSSPDGSAGLSPLMKRQRRHAMQRVGTVVQQPPQQALETIDGASTMVTELLQTVARSMLDTGQGQQQMMDGRIIQAGGQEVVIKRKMDTDHLGRTLVLPGSSIPVSLPVSSPAIGISVPTRNGTLTSSYLNFGGNLNLPPDAPHPVAIHTSLPAREAMVSAVVSQSMSEPVMSGHFVPPAYMPQHMVAANRDGQQHPIMVANMNAPAMMTSDGHITAQSLSQTIHPSSVPGVTVATLTPVTMTEAGNQKITMLTTAQMPPGVSLPEQLTGVVPAGTPQGNFAVSYVMKSVLDPYTTSTTDQDQANGGQGS